MQNLASFSNLSIENIVNQLNPESKYENAIFECSKWLLDCGNFLTEFKSINDKFINFENENTGKQYKISYKWNSQKWKWEFIAK